jgi:hypothetical protein
VVEARNWTLEGLPSRTEGVASRELSGPTLAPTAKKPPTNNTNPISRTIGPAFLVLTGGTGPV